MTDKVGSPSIYHTRLPHQRKLEKMAKNLDLSKEARVRLSWLTHYKRQGNASVTSRRFGGTSVTRLPDPDGVSVTMEGSMRG